VYSVLIAGTVYYWQHRQMTGGGVARFTACDILSLREAGRQTSRERDTHKDARRLLALARTRLPHGPQSSSKQKGGIDVEGSRARCPELMTYSGPAATAGDDRDMFGGVLV
jgi:hypothetical protein